MSNVTYVNIEFENVADTEALVLELMGKGYNHITGDRQQFIGYVNSDTLEQETADKLQQVVHDRNGGCWVEVSTMTEKDVDHLL